MRDIDRRHPVAAMDNATRCLMERGASGLYVIQNGRGLPTQSIHRGLACGLRFAFLCGATGLVSIAQQCTPERTDSRASEPRPSLTTFQG
jgi:hypothetical protein